MIDNNHEKAFISQLETLNDTTESRWFTNSCSKGLIDKVKNSIENATERRSLSLVTLPCIPKDTEATRRTLNKGSINWDFFASWCINGYAKFALLPPGSWLTEWRSLKRPSKYGRWSNEHKRRSGITFHVIETERHVTADNVARPSRVIAKVLRDARAQFFYIDSKRSFIYTSLI